MARNPERRAALVDAAVEVLASEGARGLTFRAVDAGAGVPLGTSSNYFTDRDDLLHQIDAHVHRRLVPDRSPLTELLKTPKDRARLLSLTRDLLTRATNDRTACLALFEMRLEATRRQPARPGPDETVTVLCLAVLGLLLEHLTLPEITIPDGLLERIVTTIVPED